MDELRLSSTLEPSESGVIFLKREAGQLRGWLTLPNGELAHLNPFLFGAGLNHRGLRSANFSALEDFLKPGRKTPDPHEVPFPRTQQIELMETFLKEEYTVKISAHKRGLLCDLYRELFPIYWRYAMSSSTCILYDGFFGSSLAEAYLPYQSSATYRELVDNIFGSVRRDSLRSGRQVDAVGLNLAFVFKDILPLDVILHELTTVEGFFGEFPVKPELYRALLRVSPVIRRRLFSDIITDYKLEAVAVEDALELLAQLPDERLKRLKGVKSWNGLHRRLMSYCDTVEGDEKIVIPPILKVLEEPIDGIVFTPLATASDYVATGDWLAICIGKAGYFLRALRGESICLLGSLEGEPYAALELKNIQGIWHVKQLRKARDEWFDNQKFMIESIEKRLNGGPIHA